MPKKFQRSTRYKRIKVRTPSGKIKERFERRKSKNKAHCAICKTELKGIGEKRESYSHKKPTRKFGGMLCTKCTETVVKYSVMLKDGQITLEEVPIKYTQYLIKI